MDSSSAVCSFFSPPSNFVSGHDSTMWDIVWVAPHVHRSLSAKQQSMRQVPQCPWFVLKRFRVHHCFLGRPNPGRWIVGSWTVIADHRSQTPIIAPLRSALIFIFFCNSMFTAPISNRWTKSTHSNSQSYQPSVTLKLQIQRFSPYFIKFLHSSN